MVVVDRAFVSAEALAALRADFAEYARELGRVTLEVVAAPAPADGGPSFPADMNARWRELVARLEGLLAPLWPSLLRALPALPPPDLAALEAAAAAAAKAAPKGAPPPPPPSNKHKLCFLLGDGALDALPLEALPHLRAHCGAISRAASLQQLLSLTAAAKRREAAVDLGAMAYILDPLADCPTDAAAGTSRGRYGAPALDAGFAEKVLAPYGATWTGVRGVAGAAPGQPELQAVAGAARSLLYAAGGRFLSVLTGGALAATDLGACGAALVLDRSLTDAAAARQTKYDNAHRAHERALETPGNTAALLLLRGAKAAVVATLPSTPHATVETAAALFAALAEGRPLAEALRVALDKLADSGYELECAASGVVHYGLSLPPLAGAPPGKGGPAKKK
jgi:hypothetical protein